MLLLSPVLGFSQKIEFGGFVNSSQYFGDLREDLQTRNGVGDFLGYGLKHVRAGGAGFVRYNASPNVSLRFNVGFSQIKGDDALANASKNKNRNLSFKSNILEFAALAEYNLRAFEFSRSYLGGANSTPYLFGGLAVYHFNPMGLYKPTNKYYALQPLGTEGQGLLEYPARPRYALTQINIPLGIGYKFIINQNFRLGIEAGYRFCFTDYIDDVSRTYVDNNTLLANYGPDRPSAYFADRRPEIGLARQAEGEIRGNPNNRDGYFLLGVSLSYVVFKSTCPSWE